MRQKYSLPPQKKGEKKEEHNRSGFRRHYYAKNNSVFRMRDTYTALMQNNNPYAKNHSDVFCEMGGVRIFCMTGVILA